MGERAVEDIFDRYRISIYVLILMRIDGLLSVLTCQCPLSSLQDRTSVSFCPSREYYQA